MSKKIIYGIRISFFLIILAFILYMCFQADRRNNAQMHFETMNKYLKQTGNLQVRSIPQWYSASLSGYDVEEISIPPYWLVNADGSYIQDSCYYFQFASCNEAKKIFSKIKEKDRKNFLVVDAGIYHVGGVNDEIVEVLDSAKTYFDK